jgi:prepilin-type N-terminal cleavage/methylation domain-containing protein
MSHLPARHDRSAFTLVELLVVIAIISVLIGLLIPAVQRAREAANRASCGNNLHQIALAMQLYHDQYHSLPPTHSAEHEGPSWAWMLLPNLEQYNLYQKWQSGEPYPGMTPGVPITQDMILAAIKTLSSPVPTYLCPSRRSPGSDPVGSQFAQPVDWG